MNNDTAVISRPLRADAQRNYDAILTVARQAFVENGTSASLDDIACRAGVGPGTLYRHFPTRDSLLVAALGDSMQELDSECDRLCESDDSLTALREWLVSLGEHFGTYGGLPESVAKAGNDSPLGASCSLLEDRTSVLVQKAKESGLLRADVTGRDVFVIANTLASAVGSRGYTSDDLPRLVDLFIGGLR